MQIIILKKDNNQENMMDDIYLLVIGLGVCTGVIALLGVDGFCSSNLLDILNREKYAKFSKK